MRNHKIRKPASTRAFNALAVVFVTIVALCCLVPFVMMISGSFTSEASIRRDGYSLWPREFSTEAYKSIFRAPDSILRAYGVSILVTLSGTALSLALISITAYVLSRKDFKYRFQFTFFFYFTTLFSGGMLSAYIFMVRYYHLKDTLWALIMPMMFNVFYLLIMRNFMQSIPFSLIESARIDGAGDFTTFVRIVLPLSGASLATIGLFVGLGYWNDWSNAMLYISSYQKWPLQYLLYNMLTSTEGLARMASSVNLALVDLPGQAMKLAMAVVATGPIVLAYPFVQRFFVKGVTVGAVKG